MVEDVLVLPYAKQGLIGECMESARVLSEEYDEAGRVLKVRGLAWRHHAAAAEPCRALKFNFGQHAQQGTRTRTDAVAPRRAVRPRCQTGTGQRPIRDLVPITPGRARPNSRAVASRSRPMSVLNTGT